MNGNGWQDCRSEGSSITGLSYSGSGDVWSGELAYDITDIWMDLSDEIRGIMQQARIVCDYTLTDGTKGTAYSTDAGELYAYQGDYVTDYPDDDGYTAKFDDDGLHATFRIMTDLIPDPGKVRLTDNSFDDGGDPYALHVYLGDDEYFVKADKLTMTAPAGDGTFTVFCSWDDLLGGATPVSGSFDFIEVNLNYTDKNGSIDWDSVGWGFIHPYAFTPEFTSISHERTFLPDEFVDIHHYPFEIDLKDAVSITAKLQIADTGGSFEDCPAVGDSVVSVTYSGTDGTWTCEDLAFDIIAYNDDFTGTLKKVRIVADYTMPDGTAGSLYSDDVKNLSAYSGDYLLGSSGSITDNTIVSASFQIDTNLITDFGNIEIIQVILESYTTGHTDTWDITDHISVSAFNDEGLFTISYTLAGEVFEPNSDKYIYLVCEYNDDNYSISNWVSTNYASLY